MGKQYENDFKVMVVELLKSGRKTKEVSDEYNLSDGIARCWRREYEAKSGDFSKRRDVSLEDQMIQALNKELREVKLERDILKKAVSIFSRSDR
jgi:transposase